MKNEATKFETMLVLCHYLADYYSGQWSTGYRYLCLTMRYFRKFGINNPLDIQLNKNQKNLYFYLVEKYNDKI